MADVQTDNKLVKNRKIELEIKKGTVNSQILLLSYRTHRLSSTLYHP